MTPEGLRVYPGYFDAAAQAALRDAVLSALRVAPLFTPVMPRTGKPFSVQMTNLGPLGWVSDRAGYRYQPRHPATGAPWPEMPAMILGLWQALADYPHGPEACLVNRYGAQARMGLHRDADEDDFAAPVISISLGDTGLFRIGGLARGGPTQTLKLASGDVLVLGGAARLCYHGIDGIIAGSSRLLEGGGRINLTLRRVTKPGGEKSGAAITSSTASR